MKLRVTEDYDGTDSYTLVIAAESNGKDNGDGTLIFEFILIMLFLLGLIFVMIVVWKI